ncbi:transcriptional regulator [Duganella sp. BJB488]|uniref:winged helix-turn-helix transcriptional regulator n=1 Tax=unclassified Duganella TaxID=2636909 RepID=UPI000E357343|nr:MULTISPECIES: helix-turn-helix domain-containing protein [unclassified Duganella]NVD74870.1 helix-turn-helix transcriptional regulator [Duganella sp. BJB1802]RFP21667.1 transcriptional regulator [Duganella sp. BJB489]RFP23460.1 transcriptional regulator [Duganella sp. BJB488]RFP38626.1 transcriptional regulator [Duganella sp. BJB480]
MAKRKTMQNDPCPVARSLDLVGDRWSMLLVRDAFDGIRRFSDFQRNLGVARNILSDRLGALVEEGIFAVQPASDGTSYQEYVLTPKGEDLFPVVVALRQWGERQLFGKHDPHSLLIEAATGKPVAAMLPRDHAGHVLKPAHAQVKKTTKK